MLKRNQLTLKFRENIVYADKVRSFILQLFHGCRFSSFELDNPGCLIKQFSSIFRSAA